MRRFIPPVGVERRHRCSRWPRFHGSRNGAVGVIVFVGSEVLFQFLDQLHRIEQRQSNYFVLPTGANRSFQFSIEFLNFFITDGTVTHQLNLR